MDELRDRIMQLIQEVVKSGEKIPDEILSQLVNFVRQETLSLSKATTTPTPEGVAEMWTLSGGNPSAFSSYLKSAPSPGLNQLSKNPLEVQAITNQLQKTVTTPFGQSADGIPKSELQSSNVYGFSYNPQDSKLYVKFNGKDSLTGGPVYEYNGVPPPVFKMLKAGAVPAKTFGSNKWGAWWKGKKPSLGATMFSLIKMGGYPYQKVA